MAGLLLKCIPIVLPMILAHWEAATDAKKKSWPKRWLPVVIGWVCVAVACGLLKRESAESDKWQAEAVKWQGEASSQLNRIEGRLGEGTATQRYLAGLRALTKRLADEKTGTAADKFFTSAEERMRIRGDIENANQRIAEAERIRVSPAMDFVIQKLDRWLEATKQRGIQFTLFQGSSARSLSSGEVASGTCEP